MKTIVWLEAAQQDLQRLYDFLRPHSPDAAIRLVHSMIDAADTLAEFPKKGRPWEPDPDFLELVMPFGAHGYVIRYREHDDKVVIVRVWHGRESR